VEGEMDLFCLFLEKGDDWGGEEEQGSSTFVSVSTALIYMKT
jgi:hypothetical protein